jgi:membrane-associated phospholipid phosphatase
MKTSSALLFYRVILVFALLSVTASASANDDIEIYGDMLQIVLPSLAYGMTYYHEDSDGRYQFYRSFFSTLGITHGLKLTVDKKRPNGGDHSFPSGHTSAAFSGASFIQRRYGWYAGAPAYLAAAFVGWSRIETEEHYPEDVLAGAGIGVLCTYLFTKPYLDKMAIMPFVGRANFGLSVIFAW